MKEIYTEIKLSIENLQDIFKNAEGEDEKLKSFNEEALKTFQNLGSKSLEELDSLKDNEEWENFTIAFYGETNAGKSTLIETLRMFFEEESKKNQQEQFKQLYPSYEKYLNDEQKIEDYDKKITIFQDELQNAQAQLTSLKNRNALIRFFAFLMGNSKSKKALESAKKAEDSLENARAEKEAYILEKQDITDKIYALQDGAIIGDGRSDFTRETGVYNFNYKGQSFVLLDVPGIEGSEEKVIEQISNATKKAHAIFYVKKDCNPPQKGEEGKKGTIEKIQEQLDAQTEVYTIFNKPIHNPRALKDELINENERESLKVLDEKMKLILAEHYAGHRVVSAQIAFYALSKALILESNFYKNQQKFLEILKEDELLNKSNFKELGTFISEELIKNSRVKIIKSNCNKALKAIQRLRDRIKLTIEEQINPMIEEITKHKNETCSNLNSSAEIFISDLNKSARKEIESFKYSSRDKMYGYIQRDIKDKEFKELFEEELKQGIEDLIEKIAEKFKENEEKFRENIKEDLVKFRDRIKDSLENLNRISIKNGFDLDIDIDSGVNKLGLFTSLGGIGVVIAANWWNPIGWVALSLGVIAGLIGVAKAVIKFFSSKYRQNEQRKAVDTNLSQISEEIIKDMEKQLKSGKKKVLKSIKEIEAELDTPIDNYENMKKQLAQVDKNLEQISNDVEKRSKQ